MDKTIPLYIAGALVLGVMALGQFQDARADLRASQAGYAQTLCDRAHNEIAGPSEDECARVLDQLNLDYTCDSARSNCKIEVK